MTSPAPHPFPLLLELARADATAAQLTAEGFEPWEIDLAKEIVARERATEPRPFPVFTGEEPVDDPVAKPYSSLGGN